MKEWYFYQERGKTVGPVGLEDLKLRIQEGRVRLFDLVYRDGDAGWKMAVENPSLRGEFKAVSLDTLKDRPWVVLQKKTSVAMDFITLGPFSEREVRESILAGRIAYADYVWRDGFTQWRRIASLEEFNPRASTQVQVPSTVTPPVARAELLRSVVEMKRPARQEKDLSPPPEADGEDLAFTLATELMDPAPVSRSESVKPSRAVRVQTIPKEIPAAVEASVPEPSADGPLPALGRPRRRKRAFADWGVIAVLVLALGGAGFFIYSQIMKLSKSDAVPQVAAVPSPEELMGDRARPATEIQPVKPPEVSDLEPGEVELPQTPPEDFQSGREQEAQVPRPEVSTPPTQLVLNVEAKGSQARFEVRSNGTEDYPVHIQIVGLPGQVTEGPSFYRYLKLTPQGNKPLDLSKVKLPMGKFIIRAETGDLKKESKFSLGATDPQFRATVTRQRKLHAQAIWKERLQLLRLASKLETDVGASLGGKKFKAKGYEPLGTVKRGNAAGFVLFDEWSELKKIYDEARSNPDATVLERARKQRERIAAFSVWR